MTFVVIIILSHTAPTPFYSLERLQKSCSRNSHPLLFMRSKKNYFIFLFKCWRFYLWCQVMMVKLSWFHLCSKIVLLWFARSNYIYFICEVKSISSIYEVKLWLLYLWDQIMLNLFVSSNMIILFERKKFEDFFLGMMILFMRTIIEIFHQIKSNYFHK